VEATRKVFHDQRRTKSHVRARSEKRIPRHDVRLSRYRRAPIMAIGTKKLAST